MSKYTEISSILFVFVFCFISLHNYKESCVFQMKLKVKFPLDDAQRKVFGNSLRSLSEFVLMKSNKI